MEEFNVIKIKNCNNVENAELPICNNKLNIFYGRNGTGKSTISKAIYLQSQEKGLLNLLPYGDETKIPSVENLPTGSVAIFNDEYISRYVYKKDSLVDGAFKVFIETDEYKEAKLAIDGIFLDITKAFSLDEELIRLKSQVDQLADVIKFTGKGKLSNSGDVKLMLSGKGGFRTPPTELSKLSPFFSDSNVVDYAGWRLHGNEIFGNEGCCPYCSTDDTDELKTINKVFAETFDKKSVEACKKVLEALNLVKDYLYGDVVEDVEKLFAPANSAELKASLGFLGEECKYLSSKLSSLNSFNAMSIDKTELKELRVKLSEMCISQEVLPKYFTSNKTTQKIKEINLLIDNVLSKVDILKQEIGKHNTYIAKATKASEEDINTFLRIAGINYKFSVHVQAEKEEDAQATLEFIRPDGKFKEVKTPAEHLSWGEKNAFALVMFMFDTLSKPDLNLIVLDDPISSFDTDKKYAITDRLFKVGRKSKSFYEKTVLMFTHDLEPIINYVQTSSGGQTPSSVKASFIANEDGKISVQGIERGIDLVPNVVLLKEIAKNMSVATVIRIASLRKYIEHTYKDPSAESPAYHVLSSLIHRRQTPSVDRDGSEQLSNEKYDIATKYISHYIDNFNYTDSLQSYDSILLLETYERECNAYFKMLILRAYAEVTNGIKETIRITNPALRKYLDETNHIENDNAYILDYQKFNIVPNYILEEADNFVASLLAN